MSSHKCLHFESGMKIFVLRMQRGHENTHTHTHTQELTLWGQMGGGELKVFSSVGLRFYKKNTL